jgi:hypothetical protein
VHQATAAALVLQAALIVSESGGKVMEAQGELITTQYFDSLAAEINDLLQVSSSLSSSEGGTVSTCCCRLCCCCGLCWVCGGCPQNKDRAAGSPEETEEALEHADSSALQWSG